MPIAKIANVIISSDLINYDRSKFVLIIFVKSFARRLLGVPFGITDGRVRNGQVVLRGEAEHD